MPPHRPDGARRVRRRLVRLLSDRSTRAWLFLVLLLIVFETWARVSYGASFVLSSYNAQSIAVFAVAPLLLALGETFVIIAGGIDLSVGFIMGLSAVDRGPCRPIVAGGVDAAASRPCWSASLAGLAVVAGARRRQRLADLQAARCRRSSARSACSAWRAARPFCSPAAPPCRSPTPGSRRSATAGCSAFRSS